MPNEKYCLWTMKTAPQTAHPMVPHVGHYGNKQEENAIMIEHWLPSMVLVSKKREEFMTVQQRKSTQNPRLILRRVILGAASGEKIGADDQFAVERALTLGAGRALHQNNGISGPPRT